MTATATKTRTNGSKAATVKTVKLKPVDAQRIKLTIEGMTPYVAHKWSEKAKEMIREKQAGKKTRNRDVRDPEQEAFDATYFTEDGKYGVPAMAVKSAIIGAAHKDLGVEKVLVRKSLFLVCQDPNGCLPMTFKGKPVMREDHVRVGMGGADLRYRNEFFPWAVTFTVEYDAGLLQVEDIVNLVNRAGFGVGVGECRPEKGGEWGRFRIREDS